MFGFFYTGLISIQIIVKNYMYLYDNFLFQSN